MRIAVLLLIASCDQVYGLSGREDGGTGGDACILGDFDPAVVYPLPQIFAGHFDPAMSNDQLELFSAARTSNNDLQIMVATRPNAIEPWSVTRELVAEMVSSPMEDADPSITEDGEVLVFNSMREAKRTLWQISRSAGSEWGVAKRLSEIDVDIRSADLSADGLHLYVIEDNTNTATLHRFDRLGRDQPFQRRRIVGTGTRFPSVSRDETEIYYHDDEGIMRMRVNDAGMFVDPERVIFGANDADLSFDGTTLTFTDNRGGFAQLKRGGCQ